MKMCSYLVKLDKIISYGISGKEISQRIENKFGYCDSLCMAYSDGKCLRVAMAKQWTEECE